VEHPAQENRKTGQSETRGGVSPEWASRVNGISPMFPNKGPGGVRRVDIVRQEALVRTHNTKHSESGHRMNNCKPHLAKSRDCSIGVMTRLRTGRSGF
jgi:hypothetical protein